jgi:hypothetical protein
MANRNITHEPLSSTLMFPKRRTRYPGKNPRAFHLKYKELNPGR